jgi:hypothetical protein
MKNIHFEDLYAPNVPKLPPTTSPLHHLWLIWVRSIVARHLTEVLLNELAVNVERGNVKENEEHATALSLAQVLPLVVAATVDAAVTGKHDLALATVEGEEELALDDDAIVDAHGAVDGALHTGREVNEAGNAAVLDVNRGLVGGSEGNVLLLVEVDLRALCAVDDVGDGLAVDEELVVVALVVLEKYTLALGVVGGYETPGWSEVLRWEAGKGTLGERHFDCVVDVGLFGWM